MRGIVMLLLGATGLAMAAPDDSAAARAILARADSVILPRVELRNCTVRDAVDYAEALASKFDPEKNPARRGFGLVLKGQSADTKTITLSLVDASALTVLREIAKATGNYEVVVEDRRLVFREIE